MRLNLTIDRGNTAVKAAVWRDGELLCVESGRDMSAGALADILSQRFGRFGTALYCTVVRSLAESDMESLRPYASRVEELSHTTPMPISIAYRTPSTLGRDRIAAAVGARTLAGEGCPLLIVDIGTAVTYDFLSADNVFEGGNIAPGIFMRMEALHQYTDALPAVETAGESPLLGVDTESAIRSGAIRGVAAETAYYRHLLGGTAVTTVITGGSADLVTDRGLLPFTFITDTNLVHTGLNTIINYNED